MPSFRLICAVLGVLVPLSVAGASQAAPHKRHPSAHVRTATYRVAPAPRPPHRLRAALGNHRHVAQAHRPHSMRRG